MASTGIIEHWRASLSFFQKDQLKLFLLITLNTTRRGLVSVVSALSWQVSLGALVVMGLLLAVAMPLGSFAEFSPVGRFFASSLYLAATVGWLAISVVALLATRSSTERKDGAYFRKYLPVLLPYLVILSPLNWGVIPFFLCDLSISLRGSWEAFKRGARFALYQLPVMAFLAMFFSFISAVVGYIPSVLSWLLGVKVGLGSLVSLIGLYHLILFIFLYVVLLPLLVVVVMFFTRAGYAAYYDRIKFAQHERYFA